MQSTKTEHEFEVAAGDQVMVSDGPFKNFEGKVESVDKERGKLKVMVNMFGRETPVELDFLQIKPL
jgi:transcriptional antiterminator NusG